MFYKQKHNLNISRVGIKANSIFRNYSQLLMMLFLIVFTFGRLATANTNNIFIEDFSGDLSQWNIWHYSTPHYIAIINTDGNPLPCLLLDDKLNYGTYAVSKQTFSYVGTSIECSADIKHGSAAFSDQRTAFLHLCKQNVYIPGQDYFVRIGISGSSSPNPNKVYCRLLYEDSGSEIWESSEFSISNGDGWHNAKISIRDSGIVDFYLDNVLIYTSIHPITPAYNGQASVMIGRRKSLYDNVVVSIASPQETPSPSEQIADILEFVSESRDNGTLVGNGRGKSAENKLNALINMLENSQWLIENDAPSWACEQLLSAYKHCDGQDSPKDHVTGDAAIELAESIMKLVESITSGAIIVTVDGLSIVNTLTPFNVDDTEHYLATALREMDLDLMPDVEIESFTWSRDAGFPPSPNGSTWTAAKDLRDFLRYQYDNKGENKKFIVVAHSWGTFLSYCALSDLSQGSDPVQCDLWITLSSPLGTHYAHDGLYIPEENVVDAYVIWWLLELSIDPFNNWIDYPIIDEHYNFWAWGDFISGPLAPFLGGGVVDEILDDESVPLGHDGRKWDTFLPWHLYTGLNQKHPNDPSQNKYLNNKVKALIIDKLVE